MRFSVSSGSARKADSLEPDPVNILLWRQPTMLLLFVRRRCRSPIEFLLHAREKLFLIIGQHLVRNFIEPEVVVCAPKLVYRPGPSQQPIDHVGQFFLVVAIWHLGTIPLGSSVRSRCRSRLGQLSPSLRRLLEIELD